jgi:hypothetical protein
VAERIFAEEMVRATDPAFQEKTGSGLFQPKDQIGLGFFCSNPSSDRLVRLRPKVSVAPS